MYLTVESQQNDHEEEHNGPERRSGQQCQGLRIGNKRKTGTCNIVMERDIYNVCLCQHDIRCFYNI